MANIVLEKILNSLRLPDAGPPQDLDSLSASLFHLKTIREKPFLKNVYLDFYGQFLGLAGPNSETKRLVELGSGGGFLKEIIPHIITSDLKKMPDVDLQFSAYEMPFPDGSVDCFFGLDILHHLGKIRDFLNDMNRCLAPGGKAVFIEPANTLWSRFVYENFHHEGFDPRLGWEFKETGPLSSANGALPWIIFIRDQKIFEKEFPTLHIKSIKIHTPLRYLLSGGVSFRQLLPSFFYPLINAVETVVSPLNGLLGMFMTIELEKKPLR